MEMIKFPIKFDTTGLEKLSTNSREYYAQLLSICLLTEPGTHPFTPSFGANDPSFTNIDKGVFILNASRFIPEVTITDIDISAQNSGDGSTRVSVSFEITEI
jgi:hypothetical protein